jgi:transposase InsO family protein
MPWKEYLVPDERMRFVLSCLDAQDSMAALCRRFGVSRRTGYKWLARYQGSGPPGLSDRNCAAHTHPNQVEGKVEALILAMRSAHPTWGARKVLAALVHRFEEDAPTIDWPAASTVGQILKRAGLVVPRRRRRRLDSTPPGPRVAAGSDGPNRLWCADFKGWFRTGDGSRCDPLTISDAHSRYLLRCQTSKVCYSAARGLFEATFREFGLPDAIRTDNGEPFASVGLMGLSRLAVWWTRLGITHQRIEPGRPQQNGSHERMHGTLKRETASPPALTLRAQQARFDAFCVEYNDQRPHEGLAKMATPGSLYTPSARRYPERLPELIYSPGHQLRWVDDSGKFRWDGLKIWLGKALAEQVIGLSALEGEPSASSLHSGSASGGHWMVRLGPIELGIFDSRQGRLLRPRERRHLVSPSEPTR